MCSFCSWTKNSKFRHDLIYEIVKIMVKSNFGNWTHDLFHGHSSHYRSFFFQYNLIRVLYSWGKNQLSKEGLIGTSFDTPNFVPKLWDTFGLFIFLRVGMQDSLLHFHNFHLTRGMCLGVSFALACFGLIPYLSCFKFGSEHKAMVITFKDFKFLQMPTSLWP